MFKREHRIESTLLACLVTLVLAACDSGNGGGSVAGDATEAPSSLQADVDPLSEEGALDMLDSQPVIPFDVEPSLGFALPPHGKIYAKTTAVGTRKGLAFELACGNERVLVGMTGQVSDKLERLQPVCVSANDSGRWVGTPATLLETAGSGTGQPFTRTCPVDHAVSGMASDFANDYPAYLQIQCRKLDSKYQTSGARVELDGVGTLVGKPTQPQCSHRSAATGIYGDSENAIDRVGLVCYENPAFAGRWSSQIDWPHVAIHSVMLSDGKVMTYGTGGSGNQGAMEYDVWDPKEGYGQQSHTNIQGTGQVDSFCGAAALLPSSGEVLLPAGDARPLGANNAGIRDALLFSPATQSISHTADMEFERWYPSTTMMPDGDLVIVGGRDGQRNNTPTPEVYDPDSGSWRSLNNASTAAYSYFYPRQFLVPDGRVFGISGQHMFFLDTAGQGTLTDAGDLPQYAIGTTGTAAMYEPGKILYVGGWANDGYGAALIDVTSGSPQVTRGESLSESRRAWSSSVILADGKVLVLGGSYITNDAVTASLGVEAWDPASAQWISYSRAELPRLYHSTGLLLTDARVLLAGGGSPGPLTNLNAEIFSPPYLFDENGAAAERPVITEASDTATWGEQLGIRTSDDAGVSRVTMVRTGSITHGFNMEQRILEIPFSQESDSLALTMPASGNLAPPGFYMLFVHRNGTPSEAHMLDLGQTPATDLPPLNTQPPLPPVSDASLLLNGGFENGEQGWTDCSTSSLTGISSQSVEGSQSMKVTGGGCMYQVVNVQPGSTYALSCETRATEFEYASLSLQMLDAGYNELEASILPIETQEFNAQSTSLEAPAQAFYASVTFYSEGTAHFDRCELVVDGGGTPPQPPVVTPSQGTSLIANGDFEAGKTGWNDCANPALSAQSSDTANGSAAMQIKNAGCLYQEFAATPGKTYELTCLAKSDATLYSSMSLTLMDQNYTALASDFKPVGRNFFQAYQSNLFTPVDGAIGAVTLYSEDTANFDDCSIVEL